MRPEVPEVQLHARRALLAKAERVGFAPWNLTFVAKGSQQNWWLAFVGGTCKKTHPLDGQFSCKRGPLVGSMWIVGGKWKNPHFANTTSTFWPTQTLELC